MSTVSATSTLADERTPRVGYSLTFLRLELRRLVRNRRTVIFTLLMPAVFFLAFGTSKSYRTESAGTGNVTAYVMVSMAVYGAMIATTSGGASVSIERAVGWSRQLRLTPLRPIAYIAMKMTCAMLLGLAAVVVVFAVGWLEHAQMPASAWVECGLIAWVGSLVFAAFGLFMGYLLPSENVMQILGPGLALLAFAGGLFIPLDDGSTFATFSAFTPMNGLAKLCRAPLTGDWQLSALVNVVVWGVIFAAGAAWRFRRDTARV
ncbi:ABC transporter permease [Angustibacter luteus]|uniref:ABC transporter permease n=1 Tax=Angustibacter luteus TaxID=658456 RepID=A0ABW1JL25_9ACTN